MNREIICLDVCEVDSALFFQDIEPDYQFIDSLVIGQYMHGFHFDQFPGIKPDILTALSFYPELANTRIRFLYRPIMQTMNSRPSLGNIFRKRQDRRYTIIVNISKGKNRGLPMEKLTHTVKTGWIGHELAHICAYEKMSNLQVIWFTLKYINSHRFIRRVERYTDLVTVEHGLAYPLYAGKEFLLNSRDLPARYRRNAGINGLSPNEIICCWCKYRDKDRE